MAQADTNALPVTGALDGTGAVIYHTLTTDVWDSESGDCSPSDSDCCDTIDSDPDCPMAWEYEDTLCDCITDSSDEDYNSSSDEGCTPCECYGVTLNTTTTPYSVTKAFPRSKNWDFKPTENKLHYKRRDTGHDNTAATWLEILKTVWIEVGIFNCQRNIH